MAHCAWLPATVRQRGHGPVSRVLWRSLCAGLSLLTVACSAVLEVFPQSIQIPQSTDGSVTSVTFEARARLRDEEYGDILNDAVHWSVASSSGITIHPPDARDVSITVPVTTPGEYKITVKGRWKTDHLTIKVIGPSGDRAVADKSPIPSVLATFGNGPGCPTDSTFSFVEAANLGTWKAACSTQDVVTFTSYRAPVRWAGPWTDAPSDLVTSGYAPSGQVDAAAPVQDLTRKTVKVWVASQDMLKAGGFTQQQAVDWVSERANQAVDALSLANLIFKTSRVGVELALAGPAELDLNGDDCDQLLQFISEDAANRNDPSAINVYVLPSKSESEWSRWGEYCSPRATTDPGKTDPGNVIRLADTAPRNTLAHEIGHMAGLRGTAGHVDMFAGFAKDNVMFSGIALETMYPHSQLSLGQAYRMNFDVRSGLASGITKDCLCDPYGGACGRLSRDVRPIKGDNGSLAASALVCDPP